MRANTVYYRKPGTSMPYLKDIDYLNNWYIYDGSKIVGPYNAKYLLELGPNYFKSFSNIYVSKKGLDKWYPIKSFIDYFQNLYREYNTLDAQKYEFEQTMNAQLDRFKTLEQQALRALQPQVSNQRISQIHNHLASSNIEKNLTEQTLKETKQKYNNYPKSSNFSNSYNYSLNQKTLNTTNIIKKNNINFYPQNLNEAYLLAKGRYRLGDIRNIGFLSIIAFIFTLGFNYFLWLLNISKEINWHLYFTDKSKVLRAFSASIPGLHLFAITSLIYDIKKLEKQNGYTSVSYTLAILLSFIPPFFMQYIQNLLNHHWILHTQTFMQKLQHNKSNFQTLPTNTQSSFKTNLSYYAKL